MSPQRSSPGPSKLIRYSLAALLASGTARAQSVLPTGGHVVAGGAAISAPAGNNLTVTQTTARAVVNWNGFSVGPPNAVTFNQPGSTAAILNRVTGSTPSTIAGEVSGNGQVYLVNPNGVAITPTGSVQVGGGFVASSLGISNQDFMGGNLGFTGNGASAPVSNAGTITAGPGGFVGLIGGTAANSGTIAVPLGRVGLGSGEAATLDLNGGGFLQVAVPTGATTAAGQALVSNSGAISAAGGTVELRAATVATAIRDAVNLSGTVAATSATGQNGSITLSGGPGGAVNVTGTLDASAPATPTAIGGPASTGAGGTIMVDGAKVRLGHHAILNASGAKGGTVLVGVSGPNGQGEADTTTIADGATILATGGGHIETSGKSLKLGQALIDAGIGGSWLTDPTNLTIDATAATTIDVALNAGTSVTEMTTATGFTGTGIVSTGAGDITVASALSWNSAATLTLSAYNNILVEAAITAPTTPGMEGALVLTYNNQQGGANMAGSVGFVPGQGSATFTQAANSQLFINNGTPVSGPGTPYTLVYTEAAFDGMASGGNYALAAPLAFTTAYAHAPIGTFTGNFNGLGNTISGLNITSGDSQVGLFGELDTGGTITNLALTGASVVATNGSAEIGGLLGFNNGGTIAYALTAGAVSGGAFTGGLVGFNGNGGSISNSGSTAAVGGSSDTEGGLVGTNLSAVSNSYATGTVSGSGMFSAGGLIGSNGGVPLTNVAAFGAVTASAEVVGGLTGVNAGGEITNAYATGHLTGGTSHTGGLVGFNNGGSISDGYWDISTNPSLNSITGGIGLGGGTATGTTTAALATGLPTGFSPLVWGNVNNQTTPYLLTNPNPVVLSANTEGFSPPFATLIFTGAQLNAIRGNLSGLFALAQDIDLSAFGTFTPIGTFGGTFNGLNNVISNLATTSGLFSTIGPGGTVKNLGIIGGSVSGGGSVEGPLAGENDGTISNAYATATVQGGADAGGLVGFNSGRITDAYATGAVSGGFAGGLVGINTGIIADTYATGAVNGTVATGGLIGQISGGSVSTSYAAGQVSGTSPGGLIGDVILGTVSGNFWNIDRSGRSSGVGGGGSSAGVLGLGVATDTSPFAEQAYTGFNFTSTPGLSGNNWVIVDNDGTLNNGVSFLTPGATMPMLAVEAQSVIQNAHQLQLMAMNGAGNYTLGRSIDATTTGSSTGLTTGTDVWTSPGFVPIPVLTGTFNGLSSLGAVQTITNLAINNAASIDVGLIGTNFGGTISNVGLIGGSITGTNVPGISGAAAIGALAGLNAGSISNSYATTSVSGGDDNGVGGLVGDNFTGGTISNSYAAGRVTVGNSGTVGGLAGTNLGTISTSFAAGTVSGGNGDAGGLAGQNLAGTITNDYAIGTVTGTGGVVGGLVGLNSGSITAAYATGVVSVTIVGGLVGFSESGATIASGYYDAGTTGQPLGTQANGSLGVTTATLQAGLPMGFTNTIWGIIEGKSYPYLCWMFGACAATPQVVSGTMYLDQGPNPVGPGTPAGAGTNVFGLVNGTQFTSVESGGTAPTGANGYYYYLLAPNTLPANANVLTYAFGSGSPAGNGAAMADQVNGTATGLNILANTLHQITPDTLNSTLQANLVTAQGTGSTLASSQAISLIAGVINLQIDASGAFNFDAPVSYASGTITLNTGGAITESFAGTAISAGSLAITTPGPVTLTGASQVGTIAASVTGAGNAFAITDGSSNLTVGAVNGVTGVTTNAADISLSTDAGFNIALNAPINAGISKATLNAGGQILAGLGGSVTAGTLSATAGTLVQLATANRVGTVTGSAGNGLFEMVNTGSLIVGGPAGISTSGLAGSIELVTNAGGLTISGPMTTPAGTQITLSITGGGISETAGGSISTSRLSATTDFNAGGAIDLSQAANAISGNISLFTGNNTGTALVAAPVTLFDTGATALNAIETLGTFTVQSTGAITEGSSGIAVDSLVARTMNDAGAAITLNGNNVTDTVTLTALNAAGTALANAPITYGEHEAFTIATAAGGGLNGLETGIGTLGLVTLTDANTPVREASNAVISANTLTGTFGAGAALTGNNLIANLGTVTDTGAFSLTNAQTLSVTGAISVSGDNLTLTTTGAGSNLMLDAPLTANGNTVSLVSAGTITQPGGFITAATVTGSSVGGASMPNGNSVPTFGPWSDTGADSTGIVFTSGVTLTTSGAISSASGGVTLSAITEPDLILNSDVSGTTVTLFANGNINQTAGGITATTLEASTELTAGGSITLNSPTNAVTGNVTLTSLDVTGTALAGGAIGFTDSTGFTIASLGGLQSGIATNAAATAIAGGDLTIAAGAAVTGNVVVLSTPGNFVNNGGAGAVAATGGGRWLVYSNAPGGDTFGNLDSGNTAVWDATFAALPPASVSAGGDRYLFAQTQTLTVTTTNLVKTYGQDATAAVVAAFTETGFAPGVANAFLADTAATVVSGAPSVTSTGAPTTVSVDGGPYAITATTGPLTVASGYSLAFANTGLLTVNPATLTAGLTGAVAKVYDGTAAASLTPANYTLSGIVGGDSVGLNDPTIGTYASANAGAGIGVGVAGLALSGSAAGNYTLASTSANANIGTITPAALTIAADGQSRPFDQVNPPLTFSITSGNLVSGDTLTGALATTATQDSAAGSYPITQGSLAATANYAVAFINGVLVVLPAGPNPPGPIGGNFGVSPDQYIPPVVTLPATPGLTPCSGVSVATMLNQLGGAPLFGAGSNACGESGS